MHIKFLSSRTSEMMYSGFTLLRQVSDSPLYQQEQYKVAKMQNLHGHGFQKSAIKCLALRNYQMTTVKCTANTLQYKI